MVTMILHQINSNFIRMMITSVFFLAAAAVVTVSGYDDTKKDDWKELSQKCQKETDTILALPKNKEQSDGVLSPPEFMKTLVIDKIACYNRCMIIGFGYMNEQNQIFNENVEKKFGMKGPQVADVIKKCAEENSQEDLCIQAVKRALCIGKVVLKKAKEEQS